MNVKEDLKNLVILQSQEITLDGIAEEIAELERNRAEARAGIDAAQKFVAAAEKEVEDARAEAKRLELDLKAAEEAVVKFQDQMLNVKTNQELWAIQKEIGHAEEAVGAVETKILEQLETADSLGTVITAKKTDVAKVSKQVDALVAAADSREAELVAERESVTATADEARQQMSADLAKRYDAIKGMRAGVAVAEAYEEFCMACNTKIRPQLFVEVFNFTDLMQCENCKRILYITEQLDLPASVAATTAAVTNAVAAAAEAAAAAVADSEPAAPSAPPDAESAAAADLSS